MQAHARLAEFTDRLHRQYFVALAREPGGIATGSGTDISNADRTDGQQIQNGRVDLAAVQIIEARYEFRGRCLCVAFQNICHPPVILPAALPSLELQHLAFKRDHELAMLVDAFVQRRVQQQAGPRGEGAGSEKGGEIGDVVTGIDRVHHLRLAMPGEGPSFGGSMPSLVSRFTSLVQ